MTKKPETVKGEDLIKRKDGLYYKKYARVPFSGIVESFWENGQLKYRGSMERGELNGCFERFYDDGRLNWRENYKDGRLHGIIEGYDFDRRKKFNSKRLFAKWN